jgi:hypothetical protein
MWKFKNSISLRSQTNSLEKFNHITFAIIRLGVTPMTSGLHVACCVVLCSHIHKVCVNYKYSNDLGG